MEYLYIRGSYIDENLNGSIKRKIIHMRALRVFAHVSYATRLTEVHTCQQAMINSDDFFFPLPPRREESRWQPSVKVDRRAARFPPARR